SLRSKRPDADKGPATARPLRDVKSLLQPAFTDSPARTACYTVPPASTFQPNLRVFMSFNALYTDLSGYYDLMCADIDYQAQCTAVRRLHQLFGNQGLEHLDLACGTGPHIRSFIDFGYTSQGLDLNQPMLDKAQQRCPQARFTQGDMCELGFDQTFDLITCFLYSIHYSASIDRLKACIASAHRALSPGGVFCFNGVDKS